MSEPLKKLRRAAMLIYVTLALAAAQSAFLHLVTTDYAHEVVSPWFITELIVLGFTLYPGLRNRWTRAVLLTLTLVEIVWFFYELPVSPDYLLMIIAGIVRIFVVVQLFTGVMNQYYARERVRHSGPPAGGR